MVFLIETDYQTKICAKYEVFPLKNSLVSVNNVAKIHLSNRQRKTLFLCSKCGLL